MEQKVRLNMNGEQVIGSSDTNPQIWKERWEKGDTNYHLPVVHPMLKRFYADAMNNQPEKCRCLVPLCGKTLGMKWLAEKGHEVIGIDVVELACRQFFESHNIEYEKKPLDSLQGTIFKSKDREYDVTLYCCDFFHVTKVIISGTVDFIFDRGSLAAINFDERTRYSEVITGLMKPTTSYLTVTYLLDNEVFAGTPNSLSREELDELYGTTCSITLLNERDAMTDWQRTWGLSSFTEHVHLLKLN